jgi:hypothetical protein
MFVKKNQRTDLSGALVLEFQRGFKGVIPYMVIVSGSGWGWWHREHGLGCNGHEHV